MSESSFTAFPYQLIEGYPFPKHFNPETIRSVIHYTPRDGDLFLCGYQRCGTNWSHHTLALILRQGEPFGEDFNAMDRGPFLEIAGVEETKNLSRPIFFKTHLPFHLVPWSDKAKYVYVARNPKDACVSFYHFWKNMEVCAFKGTFDDFFEYFISGDTGFGVFLDHLEGWYEQRNRPNVLFITYEEMKENPAAAILKMASFIDDEKYAEPLRKDRQKLENVLKYSSFKEMKVPINKFIDELFSKSANVDRTRLPERMKSWISEVQTQRDVENVPEQSKSRNFVRKGIIGDWRNHFSEEQSRRLDEKFAERMKNTEIAKFWKKYM